MQTIPFKIEQLIAMARSRQLVVPEFQREFVWKEPQVRKLIDSVARSYPIGSILLLKRSDRATFATRNIDAIELPADPEELRAQQADRGDAGVYYILDGQQRVTSLIRVFANAHPKGKYYFDLRKFANMADSEEVGDNDWFIYDRARRPRLPPPNRQDRGLLKTQSVLDGRKISVLVDEFFDDESGLEPKARREQRASVLSVFETIRNFEIPAVIMDEKSALEAICRVFETINSTGTKLTTFDLATAKFYPKPNLRDFWYEARTQYSEFEELGLDGERILQVIGLWVAHQTERRFEPSRSNLLSLPPQEIERLWRPAAEALRMACVWVGQRGIVDRKSLPNEAILVPLAAAMSDHFQKSNGLRPKDGFQDLLDSWYWRSCMSRTFEASTNERVSNEFVRLVRLLETGDLDFGTTPLLLSPKILVGIGAQRDSRARVILSLLFSKSPRDIKTGEGIVRGSEYESHHIFPRALLPKHPSVESVVNRVWILKRTNRELGKKSPYEYLSQECRSAERSGMRSKLEERLAGQCIPLDAIEAFADDSVEDAFDAFLEERSKLILARLTERIGPRFLHLSVDAGDEVQDDDDADDV